VVIEICIKYPEGPTRITGTDIQGGTGVLICYVGSEEANWDNTS
jgi:hypothetical protein